MSNLARLADYRPSPEGMERRVADTDDGYTRIANELLEAVMSADLTARQLKIVLAVIRKTYGFGKKLDRITNTQIAAMTGIHHTHVCTAKNEMIAMNILISSGNQIGVNKVVSEWNSCISQVSETLANSANKSLAKTANDHSPSQLNTKETIQKKERNNKSLTNVSDSSSRTESAKAKQDKPRLSCEEVLQALRECVPDARGWNAITPKRRQLIQKFWREATPVARQFGDEEPFGMESFRHYLRYLNTSCRWMFEERHDEKTGKTWRRKSYEYILSAENYAKAREGECDDR